MSSRSSLPDPAELSSWTVQEGRRQTGRLVLGIASVPGFVHGTLIARLHLFVQVEDVLYRHRDFGVKPQSGSFAVDPVQETRFPTSFVGRGGDIGWGHGTRGILTGELRVFEVLLTSWGRKMRNGAANCVYKTQRVLIVSSLDLTFW